MTFEQLTYFIAVVEHDTFFDAADSLHITQSALSKQIMKLERELGISLLDRSRRTASLTEAGELFYKETLGLHHQYQKTLKKMQVFQKKNTDALRIGTLPILNQYHLTQMLQQFGTAYPDIPLVLEELEEQELLNGFEADKYDFIIARDSMIPKRTYQTVTLARDELVAVLPSNHPLCSRSSVTLDALSHEKFLLMNRYTSICQLCLRQFKNAGIEPDILRTGRVESILSAVSLGEGISLLAKSNFSVFHHEHITALPLAPSISLPVLLVQKKTAAGSPAAARTFLQFVQSFTNNF